MSKIKMDQKHIPLWYESRFRENQERLARKRKQALKRFPNSQVIHPIRLLRLRLGLTQTQMAQAIGKSHTLKAELRGIENGKLQPSSKVLTACMRLARAKNLPFEMRGDLSLKTPASQSKLAHAAEKPEEDSNALIMSAPMSVSESLINSYRSPIKREYARAFWQHLTQGHPAPKRPANMSSITRREIRDALSRLANTSTATTGKKADIQKSSSSCSEVKSDENFDGTSPQITRDHDPHLTTLLGELSAQTDTLHETAHALAANAHAGLNFPVAAAQLEAMRRAAGVLLQNVARWEDACAQCECPALNPALSAAAAELETLIAKLPAVAEIRADDPRLREFLLPISLACRDAQNLGEAVSKLSQRPRDPHLPDQLAAHLQTLHHRIEALATLSFEEELQQFFELTLPKNADERQRKIAHRRFGLDGRDATLEFLAADFKVSRERIRQIATPHQKAMESLSAKKPFAPRFDHILQSRSSCFLSKRSLHLWAKFLGRQQVFEAYENDSDIQSQDQAGILQLAVSKARRWGMASQEELRQQLPSSPSDEIEGESCRFESDELRALLEAQPGFQWLDEEKNWFWFSNLERGGRHWNPLLTQIKKIFAVTNHIYVMELREGVSRHHRREGFAPPRKVLLEFCRRQAWLEVAGEEIILKDESQVEGALSFNETILFHALRANGGVAARRDLEKECFARGMNETTFTMYLGASPIILRHATSVYSLRGASVEPGRIEDIISQVERGNKGRARVLQDYGWKDGDLWLGYKISIGTLNGVCSIPASLKNFMSGEFQLQTFDDLPVGTLACGENQAWGISPFMKRRGAEIGDYFLLRVNLQNRIARIALGDESLLDEYQTPLSPND